MWSLIACAPFLFDEGEHGKDKFDEDELDEDEDDELFVTFVTLFFAALTIVSMFLDVSIVLRH